MNGMLIVQSREEIEKEFPKSIPFSMKENFHTLVDEFDEPFF